MQRPHVVFVDHVARLSGGEIALLRVLPELSKHVRPTVLLGEDGPLVDRLRGAGVAVEVLPLPPRLRDVRREAMLPHRVDPRALAELPSYILRLRARIRALEADLVHTNSLKAAVYGGVAGRLAGVPVVWHVRDRIAADYLPAPAVHFVRLLARVLPSALVANSRETMTTVQDHGRRNNIAVVPDAVGEVADVKGVFRSVPVVGMVGRLAPWKGQDVFLDAFAQAFRGGDVRARLVGSALFGEEAYARSLWERGELLGISEQVEFRGFQEDIWAELAELDILVHCSVRPEPFGQVVLEGLAAGVPVVAAAAGGPAELITNGVDGILTTPGDSRELAEALQRLVEDRVLRERLAAAGKARSRDFMPERTVGRLLEIYERVLAKP